MGQPFQADPNWKPACGVDLTVVERLTAVAQSPKQLAEKRQVLLIPDGYKTETLPALHEVPLPDHIRQSVLLSELGSFTSYVKQFQTATTRIFGDKSERGAEFHAVLDYHEGGRDGKPSHATHRATYCPRFSDEFNAWLAGNGKPWTQEQFLEHLRRWGFVVTSHDEADLVELISSLEFTTNGQFASKIERTRGGRQLTWNETVDGSGQVQGKTITVPDKIKTKMPIFLGGRDYEVEADLLYRVSSGRLTIAWEIKRVTVVIRTAINDLVTDIAEGTGIGVFIGENG